MAPLGEVTEQEDPLVARAKARAALKATAPPEARAPDPLVLRAQARAALKAPARIVAPPTPPVQPTGDVDLGAPAPAPITDENDPTYKRALATAHSHAPIITHAPDSPSSALIRGAYVKNGHPVVDTGGADDAGHVPTHRLDQPTDRQPNESFEQYEARVIAKKSWSPDTTARNDLRSLDPKVEGSAQELLAHAKKDGVSLSVGETKRSQERQEMLFQKGRDGKGGQPVTWTLTSDHTPGKAIDFTGDASALEWLQKNAPSHGFSVMGSMDPGHVALASAAGVPSPVRRLFAPAKLASDALRQIPPRGANGVAR